MNETVLKDRGSKKWVTAFMMPEHVKMMNDFHKDYQKVPKPILDEQEMEQLGIIIMESLNYTLDIRLTMWKDGYFEEVKGIVSKVDVLLKQINIEISHGEFKQIRIENITSVERIT